jgi:hypothetical protein
MAKQDVARSLPAVRTTQFPVRADRPGQLAAYRAGALAIGAAAAGALALGALAIGALTIGRLSIGRSAVGDLLLHRGRARRVEMQALVIEELIVGRLAVREFLRGPTGHGDGGLE